MIEEHVCSGQFLRALNEYSRLQRRGILPDNCTLSCALKACSRLPSLRWGSVLHVVSVKTGLGSYASIRSSLTAMYAKCAAFSEAHKLFNAASETNPVVWNALIAGYLQHRLYSHALPIFTRMQFAGAVPTPHTLSLTLLACSRTACLDLGKRVHLFARASGLEFNPFVANSLVDMYSKCNSVSEARQVFDKMPTRGLVSYNAMIVGCVRNSLFDEALHVFSMMQDAGVKVDGITVSGVLPACASLATLQQGKAIHAQVVVCTDFRRDSVVDNALLDMYAKCGSLQDARQLFDKMVARDLVSWNSVISGYAMNGCAADALCLFLAMKREGVAPDAFTFMGVLSACSHSGLVQEGLWHLHVMREEYGIRPGVEHFACIVDLLCRAGRLEEAWRFVREMPIEPNVIIWRTLLRSSQNHHMDMELGKRVAESLLHSQPDYFGNYVLLSNIYASFGKRKEVAMVRKMMKERGVKKSPGCSWIEVKGIHHCFVSGYMSHPWC